MIPWKWLIIDGWKPHAVPAYLASALIEDLSARPEADGKPVVWEGKDIYHCYIDQPGMAYVDRPTMTFQIDGLSIEIPCEDVLSFVDRLLRMKPRSFVGGGTFAGVTYYKLHAFNRCVVLTPDLCTDLLDKLKAAVPQAEATATAFYADKKPTWQVLQEVNEKANDKPQGAYADQDFGGHKNDRFHQKKKGDA